MPRTMRQMPVDGQSTADPCLAMVRHRSGLIEPRSVDTHPHKLVITGMKHWALAKIGVASVHVSVHLKFYSSAV